MHCRHCQAPVRLPFVDLGSAPPSNAYLAPERLREPELWFPLRVLVCEQCWLVQTEDFARREMLFDGEYAYFSSYSDTWLEHARRYVAAMVDRLALGPASLVVELAANDGYLLQFVKQRGIPCVGVEPTASTAAAARGRGIDVVEEFFGVALAGTLAAERGRADLIAANNVLAHVPDINDFVRGVAHLLAPEGVATFEFPHLLSLVAETQFDTIYHEHFSYLSLTAVETIFAAQGLEVFDVELLSTHGGSLRVFARRAGEGRSHGDVSASVEALRARELGAGLSSPDGYRGFQARAETVKDDLVSFLIDEKRSGRRVAAYGAAAKGNTLLNFAGVRADLVSFVVDRNPAKQGKFLPGSHIPIVSEDHLRSERPDTILVLPWNLADEIQAQLAYARGWGARFARAVPRMVVG